MAAELDYSEEKKPGNGTLTLLCVGHGSTHFVFAATIMLAPYIRQTSGLNYLEVTSLGTLYYAAAFLANFLSGYLVDAFKKRMAVQLASLTLAGGGMIVSGISGFYLDGTQVFVMLAIGWALCGMGNQAWHPAAFAYLAKYYKDRRGFVFSMHVVSANAGDAIFPLIAGFLLGHIFVEASGHQMWSPVSLVAGIPCLLTALILGRYVAKHGDEVVKVRSQAMSANSYFKGYVALLRNGHAMLLALVGGLRNASQTALLYFLPLYMVDILFSGPVLVGTALTLLQVGGMISAPIAGIASDRSGERPVVFSCLAITTVVLVLALFVKNPTYFVFLIALVGLALYAVRPVVQSWMMDLVSSDFRGSATSVMFGVQSFMNVIFLFISGYVADLFGLVIVFYIITSVILFANILTFFLPKPHNVRQVGKC